jgi:IclR family mhp operon transcriptional activator
MVKQNGPVMSEEAGVQSIARVLQVLEILNERDVTGIDLMHRLTALPKPTLVRLLRTLVAEGYVLQVSRRDGYCVTEKVLRLASGFRYKDAVVAAARPLLEGFTRRHKWQVSIGTLDRVAMRVRFNTKHISPFDPDQAWLNKRVGLIGSALGRAYLAYCSEAERGVLLAALRARSPESWDRPGGVEGMLEDIRRRRYAIIERDPHDHVRSFAVPVMTGTPGSTAVAALAMFYFASTMSEERATRQYLGELYDIGGVIARTLTESYPQQRWAEAPAIERADQAA